ncbi:MAG: 2-oxoacid:acceptor oxidoreductase family protein [Anaerolineaceae bacterium]|nr:2-oxoacid:acceptor oxidoreductase family protein [Anaerolineaceae bacterium]
MKYDIFFAGVGGQGILTIGEVLAEVAEYKEIPANFYPSKGMAQRGGFVKAQLRLGRQSVGSNIPQRGADMVIAMEQSESLKAIPYIKKDGDFVLYGDIWAPTAVALGKAPYPTLEQIKEQVALSGARLVYIDPASLPTYAGEPVHPNLFVLGVIIGQTTLGSQVDSKDVEHIIQSRFKRNVEANLYAYHAGLGQLLVTL